MGNMKGPATLANEFPECANYETPTVTFTERVSISNATVDSVNLKFTSSDRMETCSFENIIVVTDVPAAVLQVCRIVQTRIWRLREDVVRLAATVTGATMPSFPEL